MAKNKEVDFEKEVERLARKSNINIRKTEYAYENQLRRLDSEIDKIMDDKFKQLDENSDLKSEYLNVEFKHDTINRYREKLKKI